MAIDRNYNALFKNIEKTAKEVKTLYFTDKKQQVLQKGGVSDQFMISLNVLIDNLIMFGEAQPKTLPDAELDEILEYSESPIFVGGVHKSGTTLLRNLLDGHSSLAVLPLDGPGIPFFKEAMTTAQGKCHHKILQQILKRLIVPNPQRWFDTGDWLLSNGEVIIEPYITFVRIYYSWISRIGSNVKGIMQSLATAYRGSICQKQLARASAWVHKSTLHIEDAEELSLYFPKAKFLHIARHPCGIYASQKIMSPLIKQRDCNPNYELECLQKGFSYGISNYMAIGSDRYHILKYEDLVKNVQDCMKQTISFLNYDYEDILIKPSIAGVAVKSNTAYRDNKNEAGIVNNRSVDIWNKKLVKDEINILIHELRHELPFYGYLKGNISSKDFFRSLLRVELKYFSEKGVKMISFKNIVRMTLNALLKRDI